jgi:hypothetical protein
MEYSNYLLLWIEICAVTIVFGIGLWSVRSTGRDAKTRRRATLPFGGEHDMRRDSQGLSLD